ncbi:MAG: hypothetical protein AMXMBFR4_33800 [Candidatus Hydrogenedentota bacterium]
MNSEQTLHPTHAVYEERQTFGFWVFGLLVAVYVAIAVSLLTVEDQLPPGGEVLPGGIYMVIGISFLFLMNFFLVTTRVMPDVLYVRFGVAFPMFWKRIPIASIRSVRVVSYRPLRDAGGWGFRFGRFEGRRTTYLTARGNRGVLVQTATHPYIIGSQSPEALCQSIEGLLRIMPRNAGLP